MRGLAIGIAPKGIQRLKDEEAMYVRKTALAVNVRLHASFFRRDPGAERGRGALEGDDLANHSASPRPRHGKFGSKNSYGRHYQRIEKVAYVRAQQHASI
jgi:hypothetical protein